MSDTLQTNSTGIPTFTQVAGIDTPGIIPSVTNVLNSVTDVDAKYANATLNLAQKKEWVEQKGLEKAYNIDGYSDGFIVSLTDPDSGKFNINGQIVEGRLVSGSYHFYDAQDSSSVLQSPGRKSELARQKQLHLASQVYNKPSEQLTAQELDNFKAYQELEVRNSLTNKDYQFNQFNPNTDYKAIKANDPIFTNKDGMVFNGFEGIPTKLKVLGYDAYGRALIDAVNPNTNRSLGFDLAKNPFLNSRFNLEQFADTIWNRRKDSIYNRPQESMMSFQKKLLDNADNDGVLGELLDVAYSMGIQSWARINAEFYETDENRALLNKTLDSISPTGKWTDISMGELFAAFDKLSQKDADYAYYKALSNPAIGQRLADMIAGVKDETRNTYINNMTNAIQKFESGDVIGGSVDTLKNIHWILAESAVDMGSMLSVGGITRAGLKAVPAYRKANAFTQGAVVSLAAAIPAAINESLRTIENYEWQHQEEMSDARKTAVFAINTVLLMPETLVAGATGFFTDFLPPTLKTALQSAYRSKPIPTAIKGTVVASLIEGAQEYSQETFNMIATRKDITAEGIAEDLTSGQAGVAFVGGMGAGAALGAVGNTGRAVIETRRESRANQARQQYINNNSTTVFGTVPTSNTTDSTTQTTNPLPSLGNVNSVQNLTPTQTPTQASTQITPTTTSQSRAVPSNNYQTGTVNAIAITTRGNTTELHADYPTLLGQAIPGVPNDVTVTNLHLHSSPTSNPDPNNATQAFAVDKDLYDNDPDYRAMLSTVLSINLEIAFKSQSYSSLQIANLFKTRARIIKQVLEKYANAGKVDIANEIAASLGTTPQEIANYVLYGSNANATNTFLEEGKRPTSTASEQTIEQHKEFLRKFGTSEEDIDKSVEQVSNEIAYGPSGYYTYGSVLNTQRARLELGSLTEDEKFAIEDSIDILTRRIAALYSRQTTMLNTIANVAQEFADGTRTGSVDVLYPEARREDGSLSPQARAAVRSWVRPENRENPRDAYTVHKSALNSGNLDSKSSPFYRMLNSMFNDVKEMKKILDSLPKEDVDALIQEWNGDENNKNNPLLPLDYVDSTLNTIREKLNDASYRIRSKADTENTSTYASRQNPSSLFKILRNLNTDDQSYRPSGKALSEALTILRTAPILSLIHI